MIEIHATKWVGIPDDRKRVDVVQCNGEPSVLYEVKVWGNIISLGAWNGLKKISKCCYRENQELNHLHVREIWARPIELLSLQRGVQIHHKR